MTVGIFLKRLQSALSATGPSWFDQVSHIMVDEGGSVCVLLGHLSLILSLLF